ncbi:MAG: DUF4837 family protein [Tannerellaceae bacterium]|jgi:hypothetical protein|nr:DUF4837 family protein [Tannerellaceae bacterium]
MKEQLNLLIISSIIISVISMGCSSSPFHTKATGTPYEIVVSVDKENWQGEVGEAIKSDLESDIAMLPQSEPAFKIMYGEPGHFGTLLQNVRNIFVVNINGSMYTQVGLSYEKDRWAKGQVVLTMNAPDRESILEFFGKHKTRISRFFSEIEMNRATLLLEEGTNLAVMDSLRQHLNVALNIPYEMKATTSGKDFFWISDDGKSARSDIIVYTFPYTDVNTFTAEYLTAKRDSIAAINVPGGRMDSYMTTERLIAPEYEAIALRGKYSGVLRGLWKMVGDMMGGPFVSIVRLDEANNRVVVAEGFVYAPGTKKRNYIRRLEAVLYTLRLPGEFEAPLVAPYPNALGADTE